MNLQQYKQVSQSLKFIKAFPLEIIKNIKMRSNLNQPKVLTLPKV